MQTFLPYESFVRSADALDRQRLGKQRVETLQIMTALLTGRGWVNHPATKMWRGYEGTLLMYQEAICFEWVGRGYKDTCYVKTSELYYDHFSRLRTSQPFWLRSREFHRAHQSNLIRKNPAYYKHQFPGVPDDLEYVWPV